MVQHACLKDGCCSGIAAVGMAFRKEKRELALCLSLLLTAAVTDTRMKRNMTGRGLDDVIDVARYRYHQARQTNDALWKDPGDAAAINIGSIEDPGDAAAISIGSIEDPGDGAAISDEKVEGEQLYFPIQNMMDLLVGSLSPACLSIHFLPIMAELDAIDGGTEAGFDERHDICTSVIHGMIYQ